MKNFENKRINKPDIVVGNKEQRTVAYIDVSILDDSKIRKKKHEKIKKYQDPKKQLNNRCGR